MYLQYVTSKRILIYFHSINNKGINKKIIYKPEFIFSLNMYIFLCDKLKVSHSVMSKSCNPVDCSLPGSFVHGILQARIPEWVAISSSRGSPWPRDWNQISHAADKFFTVWASGVMQLDWNSLRIRTKVWFCP